MATNGTEHGHDEPSAAAPVPGSAGSSPRIQPTVGKKKTSKKKTNKKKTNKKKANKKKVEGAARPAARRTKFKALVVVESPAKARTIKKYLGPDYVVKASVGHIKDLPKSKLSVDIDNGFTPNYEVIRGKRKVLNEIKEAARNAEQILLAPDPDREGEAIACHIHQELGKRYQAITKRIVFNEITEKAIRAAVDSPQDLQMARYNAQQARRILDRLVGYHISPILWDKVRRGLSAGRVQSVAVRLVVEREQSIRAFVSEEYWTIECTLRGQSPPAFVATVVKEHDKKFNPRTAAAAESATTVLSTAEFHCVQCTKRQRRRRARAPLITSTLQQDAASRLRFTAKRTMMIAQQLYEGVELGDEGAVALITYMRTDSTRVSTEALEAVRGHIRSSFGDAYLPAAANTYKSKKSAQEAHEAIRPTALENPPEKVRRFLNRDQYQLYLLIWRAFVASQMVPAVCDQTTLDIVAAPYGLRATGSTMTFPGFLAAWEGYAATAPGSEQADADKPEAKDKLLPPINEGDHLACDAVSPQQHFTQPPPRFSESTLVKELEDKGIGRPSTYAAILSTVVARAYVIKEEDRFQPTELGELITTLLLESFPQVLDVEFTARMEDALDEVENGATDWQLLLKDFYFGGFKEACTTAAEQMRNVKREEIPTEHQCKLCGETMLIKWGRNGSFVACKGYPKCRNTGEYKRGDDGTIEILPEKATEQRCPECTMVMVVKRGRYGEFLACTSYPECKGTRPISIGVACPEGCGGYVAERRSGRGRVFYGCSSYPECTFACWSRPVPGPCPACQHNYLVRKYSKRDGVRIKCPTKECPYERDPELDDDDQKAVVSV